MLLRISAIRALAVLTIFTIISYAILLRWHVPASPSYDTYENRNSSSSISKNEQPSVHSSSLKNTPIYDELVELQLRPIRISPSELNKPISKRQYIKETLSYNETLFREASAPILWLDKHGDVRWNKPAEDHMINYLTEKQFPNFDQINNSSTIKSQISKICRAQSLFLLHQHWSGFFSRVLCFIAQFGQTLYSPRIGVLRGTKFAIDRGEIDDFKGQGIKRYFLPFSICSTYEYHPEMKDLKNRIQAEADVVQIARSHELHEYGGSKTDRALSSSDFWRMDYHHVPIRKWLFDRKKSKVSYESSIKILSDHSNEHIYAPKNVSIGDWINTNKPDAFPSDLLPEKDGYKLTWQDYIFGSFLRYMFVLFFGSRNAPRIELGTRLLAQHWSSYLIDRYSLPTNSNVFDKLAGLYIRRGDKSGEDSFWFKHRRWRNLSYYVKGIVDEEQRRNKTFSYIFVMTDDVSVMQSLQDYIDSGSRGTDEPYARKHLRGRDILYNVLAPQVCFDPFRRIGFDQFLVSMRFLIEYSAFTIGHTDSNVFRFFREVVYAQRQQQPGIQSFTYVRNAPNSFDNKKEPP